MVDTPAIITAVATLVTAIGGAIISVTVLLPLLQKTRAIEVKTHTIEEKTEHMTKLVNSNHEAMLRREEVLISALQRAGIDIPPNKAIALGPQREDPDGG